MGAGVQPSGSAPARGGRRRGARRSAPMSEINVTPFVDVMLVLLIIFMVAAPLLTAGVPVELPETAAQPLPQDDEPPLAVTVDAEGRVFLGAGGEAAEVPRGELVTRLAAISAEGANARVYLRADGAVPYADVAEVMGALNAGGFRNIGLVTDGGGPTLDGTE